MKPAAVRNSLVGIAILAAAIVGYGLIRDSFPPAAAGTGTTAGSAPAKTASTGPWDIVSVDGSDYVTADSLARFYRFDPPAREAGLFSLRTSNMVLKARLGSPKITINGVTLILHKAILPAEADAPATAPVLISRLDVTTVIDPILRPSKIPSAAPFHTVILDPAHGGSDPGATGPDGLAKEHTLKLARLVSAQLLNRGFKVVLTRDSDTDVSTADRLKIVDDTPGSIVITLDFDASVEGKHGLQTRALSLVPDDHGQWHGDPSALALATAVQGKIISRCQWAPYDDLGVLPAPLSTTGSGSGNRPHIEFQTGFFSAAKRLSITSPGNDDYLQRIATAIADGVIAYRGAMQTAIARASAQPNQR